MRELRLRDKVHIGELEQDGTIVGIHISVGQVEYEVRYYMEGRQHNVYFFGDELDYIEDLGAET